jgi:hypothetical protein
MSLPILLRLKLMMNNNQLPRDLARTTQIWQWLLAPNQVSLPVDATEEELIAVFSQQNTRLQKFHTVLTTLEAAYQKLNF